MKTMRHWRLFVLVLGIMLWRPGTGQAQFAWTSNDDGTLTLSGYSGSGGAVEGASPAVTGTRLTAGGLTFQLQITGGASGVIEVSSNLTNWAAVTPFAGTNTTINFTDPGLTNASQRFYRVVGR